MRNTKIICTLGPAVDNEDVLRSLLSNGMNAARVNFSHGSHEEHKARIDKFKKVQDELGLPVPILLDTKGPEIRIGTFKNGFATLESGQRFTFTPEDVIGNSSIVTISYKDIYKDIKKGDIILIDDGLIELKVEEIVNKDVVCVVQNGGIISDKKSVNIPNVVINLPSITDRDICDLMFAIENDLDFIAQSFVRTAEDVKAVRDILDNNGGSEIKIIAKIENRQGVNNLDEIISIADGIMIARGDLGVEVPFEELPMIQKMIIDKCLENGKLVITATQMLDSMIRNPRPTRAEVNDVSNAIYEGTSAIMLSGETASGKYPVEALKTMSKISEAREESIDYWERFRAWRAENALSISNAISHATCATSMNLKAAAIITVTKSGLTAQMISRYRPNCQIIAATTSKKVLRQLSLLWGVRPVYIEEVETTDDLFSASVQKALETNYVKKNDLVVITAGVPVGVSGTTNLIKVKIIGHED